MFNRRNSNYYQDIFRRKLSLGNILFLFGIEIRASQMTCDTRYLVKYTSVNLLQTKYTSQILDRQKVQVFTIVVHVTNLDRQKVQVCTMECIVKLCQIQSKGRGVCSQPRRLRIPRFFQCPAPVPFGHLCGARARQMAADGALLDHRH